jgi:hypothetical protein
MVIDDLFTYSTPEPYDIPSFLARTVEILDQTAHWGDPPMLMAFDRVPFPAGRPGKFGMVPLTDGQHPLVHLEGLLVPDEIEGLGILAQGWAYDLDGYPKHRRRRGRTRAGFLIARDGSQASSLRIADGELKVTTGRTRGAVPDALRVCLGLTPAIADPS